MSRSVAEACDNILKIGILDHEFGIPKLWPTQNAQVRDLNLEDEYYALNQELAAELDQLVYYNKLKELQNVDVSEIAENCREIAETDQFADLSLHELETVLKTHTELFKTPALLNEYLAMALPMIRAVYHGNSSLADSEFTILNNLKKLYSQYNEHPANVSRLMEQNNAKNDSIKTVADLLAQTHVKFAESVTPNLKTLHDLNQEYLVLQNTYSNQVQLQTDASARVPSEQKKLRQAVAAFSRRISAVSVLCDFLPNLILCQSSNWNSDAKLNAIVEDCQDIADKLPALGKLSTRSVKSISVEEILKTDFDELAEAFEF